jgi:hypothetical protein
MQKTARANLSTIFATNYILVQGSSGSGLSTVIKLVAKKLHKQLRFYDIPDVVNDGTRRLSKETELCIESDMRSQRDLLLIVKNVSQYKPVCNFFAERQNLAKNVVLFLDSDYPKGGKLGTLCAKHRLWPITFTVGTKLDPKQLKNELDSVTEPLATRIFDLIFRSTQNVTLYELCLWMREEFVKHGDIRSLLTALDIAYRAWKANPDIKCLRMPRDIEEGPKRESVKVTEHCPFLMPKDKNHDLFQFLVYGRLRKRALMDNGRYYASLFDNLIDAFHEQINHVIYHNLYAAVPLVAAHNRASANAELLALDQLSRALDILSSEELATTHSRMLSLFETNQEHCTWLALHAYGLEIALQDKGEANLRFESGYSTKKLPSSNTTARPAGPAGPEGSEATRGPPAKRKLKLGSAGPRKVLHEKPNIVALRWACQHSCDSDLLQQLLENAQKERQTKLMTESGFTVTPAAPVVPATTFVLVQDDFDGF